MTRLIDADKLYKEMMHLDTRSGTAIIRAMKMIKESETVNAVPVSELIDLRDCLYESDRITMRGLRSLNELIAKYNSKENNNDFSNS